MPKHQIEKALIWLGQFDDSAPEDFFSVSGGSECNDKPRRFVESQGESWYDLDFVEISWLNELIQVDELVSGHSYAEQYLAPVVEVARESGMEKANVFVLATVDQFSKPCSTAGKGYRLELIGEFTYET